MIDTEPSEPKCLRKWGLGHFRVAVSEKIPVEQAVRVVFTNAILCCFSRKKTDVKVPSEEYTSPEV
jgi:hypothetical protein